MEKKIRIEENERTPLIDFDFETGVFLIEGRSLPENVRKFYDPILEKLEEYLANPLEKTVFEMKLSYFNTASAKELSEMFRLLPQGKTQINWYYYEDDADMLEAGQDYIDIVERDLLFNFVKLPL